MIELFLPILVGAAATSLVADVFGKDDDRTEDDPSADPAEDHMTVEAEFRGSFLGTDGNDTLHVKVETGQSMFRIWDMYETHGGEVPAEVRGGAGDDRLILSGNGYVAHGDEGNDWIDLGDLSDAAVFGGQGDTIVGGSGTDVYVRLTDDAVFQGGAGDDYVHSSSSAPTDLGAGNDVFYNFRQASDLRDDSGGQSAMGGSGNDLLVGSVDSANLWWAHANDQGLVSVDSDSLYGGTGDDTLVGSHGDLMVGGDGRDRYEVVLNEGISANPAIIDDFDSRSEIIEIRLGSGDGTEPAPDPWTGGAGKSFTTAVTDGNVLVLSGDGQPLVQINGTTDIRIGIAQAEGSAEPGKLISLDGTLVNADVCNVIISAHRGTLAMG